MSTIASQNDLEHDILVEVRELIREMPPSTQKELKQKFVELAAASCPSAEERATAEEMTGKSYSTEEIKALEFSNLVNSFVLRNQLLADTISGSEVDRLLGCSSRQTRLDRVKNNTLLAVKDNGVWKYPLWQFDANGAERVVDGLPQVLAALEVSNLAKVSWLTRPNPVFAGATPLQMLQRGELERVLAEARGVGIGQ